MFPKHLVALRFVAVNSAIYKIISSFSIFLLAALLSEGVHAATISISDGAQSKDGAYDVTASEAFTTGAVTANKYTISERVNGGSWVAVATSGLLQQTSYTISRSKGNGTYEYKVEVARYELPYPYYGSWQLRNTTSSASSTVVVTLTPGTPGTVTYSPSSLSCSSSSDFNVGWGAASGGNRYELQERRRSKNANGTYNSWSGWTTLGSAITSPSFARNDLPTAYQYDYQVRARYYLSGKYSNFSAWRSAAEIDKPHCAPGKPGLPTFSSTSLFTNSIYSISWSPASGTVNSYQLQEQFNGGSWTTVQDSSNRSKSFSSRTRGNYCYRVRAVNSDASGAYTNIQCALIKYQTPSVSASMSGAVAVGANTYDSGWVGEYVVHWSISGEAISTAELDADGVPQNLLSTLSGSQSYDQPDNMGTGDKSYRYSVKACNADACVSSPEMTAVVRPYPIPSPPGGFEDNNGVSATKTYALSWTVPPEWGGLASDTPTWYVLQRDGQSQQLPGTQTSISYTGDYGQNYSHQIKACTFDTQDSHCSNFTLPKNVYIQYPAPSVPENLSISSTVALTTDSYSVSWSASTGTVHTYELQEQFEGGGWSTIQDTNALNKTLTRDSQGSYCYRVRARNVDNSSVYSGSQCLLVMHPFASVDHKASSDANSFYLSMMLQLECDCPDGHKFEYQLDGAPWLPYKKPLVFDKTTQVSTRMVYRGIYGPIQTETYTRNVEVN